MQLLPPSDDADDKHFDAYNVEAQRAFKASQCVCLCSRRFEPLPFVAHIKRCPSIVGMGSGGPGGRRADPLARRAVPSLRGS